MLQIEELTRLFTGGEHPVTALDEVTFDVRPGRMTGFVGANGAGKTTAMRIVLGVLAASSGRVLWDGAQVTATDRRSFGYMPEERGLYPKQPVAEQLVFFGRLHGMSRAAATSRVDALLERLGLTERRGDRLDTLSLGNQQRVQVAVAVVHSPTALVLDEPFGGLDPLAVDAMADLLREEVARGIPVLFSSHQLELVERLCDDLVILSGGRVVAQGATAALRRSAGELLRLVVADDGDTGWVRDVPGLSVRDVDGPVALVEVEVDGADQVLLSEALGRGPVREMSRVVPSLAEVFKEVAR